MAKRKQRIRYRLRKINWAEQSRPMFSASNIHYQIADRAGGIICGGIGVMHKLARQTGLIEALDKNLHLLKLHLPYHESDHILNFAYNILCGGKCIEDLELFHNDEAYLDALEAQRIPNPTTAGVHSMSRNQLFASGSLRTFGFKVSRLPLLSISRLRAAGRIAWL